ncbi:MAG: response regulator transcription factor [Acidimicrobiales bacterium]
MSSTPNALKELGSPTVLIFAGNSPEVRQLASALRAAGLGAHVTVPARAKDVTTAPGRGPDVVLIDLDLGRLGDGTRFVSRLSKNAAVVVMSDRTTLALRTHCVQAGATAVVNKTQSVGRVVRAVRAVAEPMHTKGRGSARGKTKRALAVTHQDQDPFLALTAREEEVLSALIEGSRAATIAREASVSISTVRSQIRAILQKLEVNSQLEAVALARRAGWGSNPLPRGAQSPRK